MIDLQSKEVKPFYCDISHMLYQDTTSNHLTYREFDAAYWEKEWEGEFSLPEGIDSIQGTKILHIGDTYSKLYPFYRKLIAELKPDIILHTGDMCDEVKVGRKPFLRYEYNTKIREILNIMEESGARIIIVPGNNDVADEIHAQCPTAEIYPENTVLELDGQMCRVGHQVVKMTFDQKWSFYGHGFTGEEWHLEDNVPGGPCRFNVSWGSFVYGLSEDKFFHIPHPKAHPDA